MATYMKENVVVPFADRARARSRNRILAQLSEEEYDSLAPWLEPREMRAGEVLCDVGQRSDFVYLVETGLVSIQAVTTRGRAIEVAMLGPDDMVGVWGLLGSPVGLTRSVCTIPGFGYRLSARALSRELRAHKWLTALLQWNAGVFLAQLAQSALCGRVHSSTQHCARWLLEAHDSVGDRIPVTQQQLSALLGLRRVTVTTVACELRRLGAVEYRRGLIEVRDRTALQRAACDCAGARYRSEWQLTEDTRVSDGGIGDGTSQLAPHSRIAIPRNTRAAGLAGSAPA